MSRYLRRILHIGLYLIPLTPLFFWGGFTSPYVTAKVLGFQILVELVLAAALILTFLEGKSQKSRRHLFLSPLFIGTAGFLAYSFFTAVIGRDLNRSLWGFIERQDGLVLLLHFFAWMAIVAWFFSGSAAGSGASPEKRVDVRSYLFFSFWISVVAALTALYEAGLRFGNLAQPFLQALSSPERLSGVAGNPTYFGPYLLFHFFFGLYFLRTKTSRENYPEAAKPGTNRQALRHAVMFAVIAAEMLIGIVIIAGQTRGVILGMVAGLLTAGISFALVSRHRAYKLACFAFVLLILLAAAATWRYRDSDFVQRIPVLQRLAGTLSATDVSATERLLVWGSAIRGIRDYPVFGWGFNNVYYALNRYYDPRLIQVSPFLIDSTETWFDKSHNFYLDLLVERGIVGLAAYLLLLGIVVRSLMRLPDRRLAGCLAGALVSYLISNAVAFDVFGSLFGFFLTLACLATLSQEEPAAWLKSWAGAERRSGRKPKKLPHPVRRTPAFKIVLVIVSAGIALYLQVEIGIACNRYAAARAAFSQDPATGISLYSDAFRRFSPYHAKEKLKCAYLIVNSVVTKRESSQSIETGSYILRLTREAFDEHPQDVSFYMYVNDMFNGLGLYANQEFARQAEVFGRKALELSPERQEAMMKLGRTYVILNQPGRAVELSRRMLKNADFPLGHWLLGLALLQNNQREEAKKEIRTAIGMGYQLNATDTTTLKGLLGEQEFGGLTGRKD